MFLKFPQTLDIKIFKFGNKKYVLDIYTSTFLEIDNITSDICKNANKMNMDSMLHFLYYKYGSVKPVEALQNLCKLKTNGILLSLEESNRSKYIPRDSSLNYFSVNLTHDCNLRCKYCYAGEGNYGLPKDHMDKFTAEKVADFIIKSSAKENTISILLFGGEPLLNFDVLKHFVLYCNSRTDKKINYTVVTNGTLLTDSIMEFLYEYKIKVQVSIDGNKKIQDFLRPFPENIGSYDIIEKHVKKLSSKNPERISARATVNHSNLDLLSITKELLNMGLKYISLEMITIEKDNELYLTKKDRIRLLTEYKKLTKFYINQIKEGNRFYIEGFSKALNTTCNRTKYLYGCGVGKTFIAITPDGDIYPCHRFQGRKDWKMGNIYTGINNDLKKIFLDMFVDNIEQCKKCWARYYCGGGCIMESLVYNNSISKPPEEFCKIRKQEIKLGLKIYTELIKSNKDFINIFSSEQVPQKK